MEYCIRYPQYSDWKQLWVFINILSQEKTFITFQGENISQKFEKQYIKTSIENIKKHISIQLIVEQNSQIIGSAQIVCKPRNQNHVGVIGISILSPYRNQGIGKNLLKKLLSETKENLPHVTIAELEVMANNTRAVHLYQSLGFNECGCIPGGIRYNSEFVDNIIMIKKMSDL